MDVKKELRVGIGVGAPVQGNRDKETKNYLIEGSLDCMLAGKDTAGEKRIPQEAFERFPGKELPIPTEYSETLCMASSDREHHMVFFEFLLYAR